jgi:predicted DNA-binding transcriptional regulator AlpA
MGERSMQNRPRGATTEPGQAHGSFSGPTLSEAAAARYLGMSRAWLRKSRTQRFRGAMDAPAYIRSGARRVVYRREDLDTWQRLHREVVGTVNADQPARSIATRSFGADPQTRGTTTARLGRP